MIGQEELYTIRQQDIIQKGASGNVNSLYTAQSSNNPIQYELK